MGDTNSKTFESAVYTEEELAQGWGESTDNGRGAQSPKSSAKLKRRASSKKNKAPEPPRKSNENNTDGTVQSSRPQCQDLSVTNEPEDEKKSVVNCDGSKDGPRENDSAILILNNEAQKTDHQNPSAKKSSSFKKSKKKEKGQKKTDSSQGNSDEQKLDETATAKLDKAELLKGENVFPSPKETMVLESEEIPELFNDVKRQDALISNDDGSSLPSKEAKKKDVKKKDIKKIDSKIYTSKETPSSAKDTKQLDIKESKQKDGLNGEETTSKDSQQQDDKVQKTQSRRWSFSRQKSKKDKEKKPPGETPDPDANNEDLKIQRSPSKKQKGHRASRRGTKDSDTSSETTQTSVERKSSKKTKSPKIFSRKSKDMKKGEEVLEDEKEDVKNVEKKVIKNTEEKDNVKIQEKLPSTNEDGTAKAPIAEVEDVLIDANVVPIASTNDLKERNSASKMEFILSSRCEVKDVTDGDKPREECEFRAADVQTETGKVRSHSVEDRDKNILIYVKDENGRAPEARSTSMKNLKTSKEISVKREAEPEEPKKDKVISVAMTSKSSPECSRITAENDPVKTSEVSTKTTSVVVTARPIKPPRFEPLLKSRTTDAESISSGTCQVDAQVRTTATRSVTVTSTAAVSPAAVTQITTTVTTKPAIIVTPAYEAETFTPTVSEKSQVRQTAMVTVSREIVTIDTPPPQPISLPTQTSSERKSFTRQTIQKIPSHGPSEVKADNRSPGTPVREDDDCFHVVQMKSPASQEHKLLQFTMQTVCQKARQLQSLLSTTHAIEAGVSTHHRLQLLAITNKETDMNVIISRIAGALKADVDSKIGESLRRVAEHVAECNLQLTTFHGIVESGNRLLEHGSLDDVIRKERELTSHLKILDKHLQALQDEPLSQNVDESKVVFIPGITDNLELKAMFGDLTLDGDDSSDVSRTERTQPRGPQPQLMWSENPWIPFFRHNENRAKTGNELMNARIREEDCMKTVTRVFNLICPKNLTGFIVELLDCGIDSEMKMKKMCEIIMSLAAGYHRLAETLALVCRCISSISVPNDSHQESRQAPRSTILNFVDRFCMRRYQNRSGGFLATGMTPAISRAGSYNMLAKVDSRHSSFTGGGVSRSPQIPRGVTNMFDQSRKYGSLRAGTSPSLRPPTQGSAPTTLNRELQPDFGSDDASEPLDEIDRRYSNISMLLFICEMFKLRLSTENTVHEWIHRLTRVDDDESIEAVCFIMFQVGRFLDHRRAQHVMNKVFVQLTYTGARVTTPGRLRAMIKDVIELRETEWFPVKKYKYWQFLLA